jgi:hypothetical protein
MQAPQANPKTTSKQRFLVFADQVLYSQIVSPPSDSFRWRIVIMKYRTLLFALALALLATTAAVAQEKGVD